MVGMRQLTYIHGIEPVSTFGGLGAVGEPQQLRLAARGGPD
jgi:hypothetical protein